MQPTMGGGGGKAVGIIMPMVRGKAVGVMPMVRELRLPFLFGSV